MRPHLPKSGGGRGISSVSGARVLLLPGQAAVMPLRDVFDHARDRLLAAAPQIAPVLGEGAIGLSLHAPLRHAMVMERMVHERLTRLAEANAFAARALEQAPGNLTVLLVRSDLHSRRGETGGLREPACMACRIAPDIQLPQHAAAGFDGCRPGP